MKKIFFANKSLTCTILSAILLTTIMAVFSACNKPNHQISFSPTLYDLTINFDEKTNSIQCRQEVLVQNKQENNFSELKFNLPANAFRENAKFSPFCEDEKNACYYDGKSFSTLQFSNVTANGNATQFCIEGIDENVLSVTIPTLHHGEMVSVAFDFNLKIPKCIARFGKTPKTINLGNFYPTLCVYENGNYVSDPYYSLGDPFYSECADYLVSITVPQNYAVATSGKIANNTTTANQTTYEIEAKNIRDFATVFSTQFKVISEKINDVSLSYFYLDDPTPAISFDRAKHSLQTFDKSFGKYAYDTLTVVETPFNAGGMEYSSLIYVADNVENPFYQDVITHEIAHQWWYSAVGSNQIESPWLDESITEFSCAYFYKLNNNSKQYSNIIDSKISTYENCLKLMAKNDIEVSKSILRGLNTYISSNEYVSFVYDYGPLMYDSLENIYGQDSFLNALKDYYETNKFKISNESVLKKSFQKHCQGSTKIIENWLNGKV